MFYLKIKMHGGLDLFVLKDPYECDSAVTQMFVEKSMYFYTCFL